MPPSLQEKRTRLQVLCSRMFPCDHRYYSLLRLPCLLSMAFRFAYSHGYPYGTGRDLPSYLEYPYMHVAPKTPEEWNGFPLHE